MTLQDHLDALKESVQHEQNLQKIWNAFFNLTAFPAFIRGSTPCEQNDLEPLLKAIFNLNTAPASFLYFEDLGIGLSVAHAADHSVTMSRFMTKAIPSSGFAPWQEPGGRVSVH